MPSLAALSSALDFSVGFIAPYSAHQAGGIEPTEEHRGTQRLVTVTVTVTSNHSGPSLTFFRGHPARQSPALKDSHFAFRCQAIGFEAQLLMVKRTSIESYTDHALWGWVVCFLVSNMAIISKIERQPDRRYAQLLSTSLLRIPNTLARLNRDHTFCREMREIRLL